MLTNRELFYQSKLTGDAKTNPTYRGVTSLNWALFAAAGVIYFYYTQKKSTHNDAKMIAAPAADMNKNFGLYFDHTLLKADARTTEIKHLCEEAAKYRFYSVCVGSSWARFARQTLDNLEGGRAVKVCVVVGFPLGSNHTVGKKAEAVAAVQDGAEEVDMVLHIGKLKDGDYEYVEKDIREVQEAIRTVKTVAPALLKVIIETSLLNEEDKKMASKICAKLKVDFIKTSTGFSTNGATESDVRLMHSIVSPSGVRVKASGGIRSEEDAVKMLRAGASRIGASKTVEIVSAHQAGGISSKGKTASSSDSGQY
eukprot:GILJ01003251.1.p1 GENE.GILJ01003251.1~~GILJ01003251.1.p1  ORF type:complete len:365 (+),score=54.61 GILJ01003251.1:163-1095(+)